MNGLENLAKMEYPGRAIILGKSDDGKYGIAVYILTGRSPSSQARKIVVKKNRDTGLFTTPLDYEKMKALYEETKDETKNPDLLIYPAVLFNDFGLAISNGKQTRTFNDMMIGNQGKDILDILDHSNIQWSYEPDKPNYTPRISGILNKNLECGLAIVKKDKENNKNETRFSYIDSLQPGKGKLIATYTGVNENPLPSFEGKPLDVTLDINNVEELTEKVYNALTPKDPEKDFRVSVATVFMDNEVYIPSIRNRYEKGGK